MSSASYGLIFVFLAAGCVLGWFANRSIAAHGDVKSTFVIGIVVFDLIHPHH